MDFYRWGSFSLDNRYGYYEVFETYISDSFLELLENIRIYRILVIGEKQIMSKKRKIVSLQTLRAVAFIGIF